jgi:hypothetical protein
MDFFFANTDIFELGYIDIEQHSLQETHSN